MKANWTTAMLVVLTLAVVALAWRVRQLETVVRVLDVEQGMTARAIHYATLTPVTH